VVLEGIHELVRAQLLDVDSCSLECCVARSKAREPWCGVDYLSEVGCNECLEEVGEVGDLRCFGAITGQVEDTVKIRDLDYMSQCREDPHSPIDDMDIARIEPHIWDRHVGGCTDTGVHPQP